VFNESVESNHIQSVKRTFEKQVVNILEQPHQKNDERQHATADGVSIQILDRLHRLFDSKLKVGIGFNQFDFLGLMPGSQDTDAAQNGETDDKIEHHYGFCL
jgi:hypothetical protein